MENLLMMPVETKTVDLAFGGDMDKLMPDLSKIPQEFVDERSNKWVKFQQDWFYLGLENLNPTPKEGIDSQKAFNHLAAIQTSFTPKHEDKQLAVAYLASIWFEDIEYETRKQMKELL